MPASDQHRLYTRNKDRWALVRDCVEGSDAIKSSRKTESLDSNDSRTVKGIHNLSGSRYLPIPNPKDDSQENIDRYIQYRMRANYVNFTGHTKDGFTGMIGRKKSEIELDSSVEHLVDNADGSGQSLQQLIQSSISNTLETGRYGLLADFPVSAGGTQDQTIGLEATIKRYPAESIVNWRESVISSHKQLIMVVLSEEVDKVSEDNFSVENVCYHRVLFLEDGIYKQRLYDENDELLTFGEDKETDIIPRKHDGSNWSEIPFQFIGSIDNDPNPDKAPLYDLAEINIGHYRNSADFEESSFLVGQPTPVISGLTQSWVSDVMKNGVTFGSRSAVLLPVEATAQLLQADANTMPTKGMELKEAQMVRIGAKIITDSGGVETAEAAKIRFAGQNSKLGMLVTNVEKGVINTVNWAMEFMGGSGENEIEINRDFYEATLDPQLLVANMQLMDRGVIAKSDIRAGLRKKGLIEAERTDEEIDKEVGDVDPMAGSGNTFF